MNNMNNMPSVLSGLLGHPVPAPAQPVRPVAPVQVLVVMQAPAQADLFTVQAAGYLAGGANDDADAPGRLAKLVFASRFPQIIESWSRLGTDVQILGGDIATGQLRIGFRLSPGFDTEDRQVEAEDISALGCWLNGYEARFSRARAAALLNHLNALRYAAPAEADAE